MTNRDYANSLEAVKYTAKQWVNLDIYRVNGRGKKIRYVNSTDAPSSEKILYGGKIYLTYFGSGCFDQILELLDK